MEDREYRYVEGLPTKYPFWGKELALRQTKTRTVIYITSAYFEVSKDQPVGMLVGLRSVWHIDDDQMKAKIVSIAKWAASDQQWEGMAHASVSAGHRELLARFLMGRWDKGKLRGRIQDTL